MEYVGFVVLIYLNKVIPYPTALGEVAIVTGSQTYGEGCAGARGEEEGRGGEGPKGGQHKRWVGGRMALGAEGAVCLSFTCAIVPHHSIKPPG